MDGDGHFNAVDNCPGQSNFDQLPDSDADGLGDACETNLPGRLTGGGSVFTATGTRVTHGFNLPCDHATQPSNLQVNWGSGTRFHLQTVTNSLCGDNPAISPRPVTASFDTMTGQGTGTLNGVTGATASWTFTDAGEPGRSDTARITIRNAGGVTVLEVSGTLNNGNQQAHHEH